MGYTNKNNGMPWARYDKNKYHLLIGRLYVCQKIWRFGLELKTMNKSPLWK
jgi:hypothetical protein